MQGFALIKKGALLAESFQILSVGVDTLRLQRQIEELTAKLETIQLRVVSDKRKTIQFKEYEHEGDAGTSWEWNQEYSRTNGRQIKLLEYGS